MEKAVQEKNPGEKGDKFQRMVRKWINARCESTLSGSAESGGAGSGGAVMTGSISCGAVLNGAVQRHERLTTGQVLD